MANSVVPAILAVAFCFLGVEIAPAQYLQLTRDGTTDYRIVQPQNPAPVDQYAVTTLAHYLQEITGAEFPVIEPQEVAQPESCIFVGLSGPAREVLGDDPLADLAEEEHVTRRVGSGIFLYGKGIHGSLYAVTEFLEGSLGWRWYSVHEERLLPSRPQVPHYSWHHQRGRVSCPDQ